MRHPASPPSAVILLGLLALTAPARAGIVVVDPGAAPGAPVLQAAIDAAANGDILLLRDGDYLNGEPARIEIVGKALTLIGDGADGRVTLPALLVRTAPARVQIRGLACLAPAGMYALEVAECAATVWVEDCVLRGADGHWNGTLFDSDRKSGLAVSYSSVVAVRCTVQGGDGWNQGVGGAFWSSTGAPAIDARSASVAVFDSLAQGGRGGDGDDPFLQFAASGGAGAWGLGGTMVFSGCDLRGGDEGVNEGFPAVAGPAITGNSAWVVLRDTAVQTGAVNGSGSLPLVLVVAGGQLTFLPAARRSLEAPALLREGQPGVLALHGQTGDAVWIFVSLGTDWLLNLGHQGTLHLPLGTGAFVTAPIVAISAPSGEAALPFVTPNLPPAAGFGQTLFMQAGFAGADGLTLGAPSAMTWVDASF